MPKMIALSAINHDGQLYEEGDAFEVADAKQAEALVAVGAAMVQKARAPKAPAKTPGAGDAPDAPDADGAPDGAPDAPAA